jgi:hypothetical protein
VNVTRLTDPVDLYPDVAARGGLAAALLAVADERGLSLGEVQTSSTDMLMWAAVPATTPDRDPLYVSAARVARYWSISGDGGGRWLIRGTTDDLAEIVTAAHAWRHCAALTDVLRSASFVKLTWWAEALERGITDELDIAWYYLRRDGEEANWPEYRALIEAAYVDPTLRQLFPFTSHWSLRLTRDHQRGPDLVCVHPGRGKNFCVSTSYGGPIVAETATAEEAVVLAVRHLPADVVRH